MRLLVLIVAGGLGIGAAGLLVLLLQGPPDPDALAAEPAPDASLRFTGVEAGARDAAPRETFTARDGTALGVRRDAAPGPRVLVLVHGSGADGAYLGGLAQRVAAAGAATVVTPDLRGHGPRPVRRGDVDHMDQLVDDLTDLVAAIRAERPDAWVAVGGHSSGGGLALRFAGSAAGGTADALLLLAPFLRHDAPTMQPGGGGWAHPAIGRIVALSILNGFGVHALDTLPVISFRMPAEARPGTETLVYTHRLNTALAPVDWEADLRAWKKPLAVLVGSDDEIFAADRFAPAIHPLAPHADVQILPGLGHLAIAMDPSAADAIATWLRDAGPD